MNNLYTISIKAGQKLRPSVYIGAELCSAA